ncbi:MAG: hypothetical protein ACRCYE_10595 [Sarcina sp.]
MNYLDDINKVLEENNFIIIKADESQIDISYKFDLVELDAAKSFADEEEQSNFNEVFVEYLKDIAYDNLLDILDEIEETYNQLFNIQLLNYDDGKWTFSLKK